MIRNTPTVAVAVPAEHTPARRPITPSEQWNSQPIAEQMRFATALSDSSIIPDAFRKQPANVWLALDMGAHMGMKPFQSFRAIHVIKGTPTFSAEAMRGMALAAGHKVTVTSTATEATVTIVRNDGQGDGAATFTIDDAKKAGYLGKGGNWSSDPESMLVARATSRCAKRVIPDLLMGLSLTEDLIDADTQPVEAPDAAVETLSATVAAAKEIAAPTLPETADVEQEPTQEPAEPEEADTEPTAKPEPAPTVERHQGALTEPEPDDNTTEAADWQALARANDLNLGDIIRGTDLGIRKYADIVALDPAKQELVATFIDSHGPAEATQ